jgi:hypothetical protein
MKVEQAGDEVPKDIENDRRVIKVNIPDSWRAYESGNGEGMWGYIRHEEDVEKYYAKGDVRSLFEVILLNSSVYYPVLEWGSVILAESRGNYRPVMARDMVEQVLSEADRGDLHPMEAANLGALGAEVRRRPENEN